MSLEAQGYVEQFRLLQPTFIGNHLPWLRQARESSLARFVAAGFPNRHHEAWKYTDLSFLAKQCFAWTPHHESLSADLIAKYRLKDGDSHQLVFIDGYFSSELSNLNNLPSAVTLVSLNDALLNQPEQVEPYLAENSVNAANGALEDLNTAFIADGVFLRVPKNTQLDLPIHLVFLTTQTAENSLFNTRNILLIEENSQLTLLEEHVSLENLTFAAEINLVKNILTQVIVKKGGHLDYYKLQQENKNTIHIASTAIHQSADSQVSTHSLSLGAKLARDNLTICLSEAGAGCELNGFYALSDHQHTDHHTRIDHAAPHGTSKEYYKGILTDKAKGVFNGKVIVHPHAQKTHSQQLNKNLLLSKTAEMNTKPELEIYADDVQCTHGATVGQIEEEALFYLRSRGLDEVSATLLLIHAFCDEMLDRMNHIAIANYLRSRVEHKIAYI